jgi:formamidopyrimidine-DNA glycosylase
MPEGPEVETIRRDIDPFVVGKTIHSTWASPFKLRSPINQESLSRLQGKTLHSTGSHGKLMWIATGSDDCLLIRLGMTGRLRMCSTADALEDHTHLRLTFETGEELRYVDPRRFGEIIFTSDSLRQMELDRMGPDPFSWNSAQKAQVVSKIKKSDRAIKNILLDQSVLAGVGNIYAAEALFVARIHPEVPGSALTKPKLNLLLDAVCEVMTCAVESRGTTFMSYVDGWGKKGDNLSRLWVFAREGEPCKVCLSPVQRLVQSGRSTFMCTKCQNR